MSEKQKRSFLQWMTIVGAILTTAVAIIIYIIEFLKENAGEDGYAWFVFFKDLIPIAWNVASLVLIILVLRTYGMKSGPGRVWFSFILGLIVWLIGEIIWFNDEAIQGIESPFPSPADYFYIAGYVFLLYGILKQLKLTPAEISKQDKKIILGFVVGLALITLIFVIYPITMDIIANSYIITEVIISFAYPLLDIVFGTAAFILVMRFKGGKFSIAWLLIGVGCLLMIVFDLVFTWIDYSELFTLYFIIDHFYNSFYMLMAIGAAYILNTIEDI